MSPSKRQRDFAMDRTRELGTHWVPERILALTRSIESCSTQQIVFIAEHNMTRSESGFMSLYFLHMVHTFAIVRQQVMLTDSISCLRGLKTLIFLSLQVVAS